VYYPNGAIKTVESFSEKLSGEGILQGFELPLEILK
jgi:hypothetical protein